MKVLLQFRGHWGTAREEDFLCRGTIVGGLSGVKLHMAPNILGKIPHLPYHLTYNYP